ncbi:MAG TPA: pilin [Patescibacteria group bacterium]
MCVDGQGNVVNTLDQKGTCEYKAGQSAPATPVPPATPPCSSFDAQGRCKTISSDFGAFNTLPGSFILRVFGILLAASGAIAVLLIMRAGYKIMTARGNPEGLQQGREQLIAAIVGLMFLIFSFVLLQVIGVDLLRIPGFQ